MIKRTLLLACAALLLLAGGAHAQTVTLDGITYTVNADGQTVSVTGAEGSIAAAVVPATVNINGKDCPVTAIGSAAFSGCTSLASIALPEGLQTINGYAFYGCTSLESIALPEGLQTINGSTFEGCTALASIDLPEGLETIGSYAFAACTALASIALPEGLQSIGEYAFRNCTSLESIALPEGLQTINGGTFDGCTALQSVDLPSTMLEIASGVFEDADLRDVYSRAVTPPSIYDDTFSQSTYRLATLYVPAEAVENYRSAMGWVLFDHIEGDLPPVSIGNVATDESIAYYANGILTISGVADITVYAQSGAQVRHAAGVTTLPLESLPCGIYIICVAQGRQRQVMKVHKIEQATAGKTVYSLPFSINHKKNLIWNYLLLNLGKSKWWNPSGKAHAPRGNNGSKKHTTMCSNCGPSKCTSTSSPTPARAA